MVGARTGLGVAGVSGARVVVVAAIQLPCLAGFVLADITGRAGIAVVARCNIRHGRTARDFVTTVVGARIAVIAIGAGASCTLAILADFGAVAHIAVETCHRVVGSGTLTRAAIAGLGRAHIAVVHAGLRHKDALAVCLVAAVVSALVVVVAHDGRGVHTLAGLRVAGIAHRAGIVVFAGLESSRDTIFAEALIVRPRARIAIAARCRIGKEHASVYLVAAVVGANVPVVAAQARAIDALA